MWWKWRGKKAVASKWECGRLVFLFLSLSNSAIGFMSFFDDNFPHFCHGIFHLRRFQQIYYSKHTWKQHKNNGRKPSKNTDEVKRKPRDQVVRIYITTKWQQPVCAPCSFVFSFVFLLYFCFNCLAFFFFICVHFLSFFLPLHLTCRACWYVWMLLVGSSPYDKGTTFSRWIVASFISAFLPVGAFIQWNIVSFSDGRMIIMCSKTCSSKWQQVFVCARCVLYVPMVCVASSLSFTIQMLSLFPSSFFSPCTSTLLFFCLVVV